MARILIRSRIDNTILCAHITRGSAEEWIAKNCYENARGYFYLNWNGEGIYTEIVED